MQIARCGWQIKRSKFKTKISQEIGNFHHNFLWKMISRVSMDVMQGICFFSCITKSPGVLDWKSKATFLATLVMLDSKSWVVPVRCNTWHMACTNQDPEIYKNLYILPKKSRGSREI